jgi:hypothetical protein
MTPSSHALRRANPRNRPGFARSVEAVEETVRSRLDGLEEVVPETSFARRRLVRVSAAGAAVAAVAAAALLTIGAPGSGTGVEDATAAVRRAATLTAAAAERSGTARVRITHDGAAWAGATLRWNGEDVAISQDGRRRSKAGSEMRVVDGVLYGVEPRVGWVDMGSPSNIDPDSGTTPAEYLAATREDVGGATLRRITGAMTGLTTARPGDGSTVYRGAVPAGLIARESGFKDGEALRVFPFGYVANDEAADPAAPLDTALTVGPDGVVRRLAATWGTDASAWTYTVTYSGLGATPAPVAPANAKPLVKERLRAAGRG